MGIKAWIVAEERRAIGANDLRRIPHVEKDMGVIERRRLAHAHEFPRADLDQWHAGGVVKMRNKMLGHVVGGLLVGAAGLDRKQYRAGSLIARVNPANHRTRHDF